MWSPRASVPIESIVVNRESKTIQALDVTDCDGKNVADDAYAVKLARNIHHLFRPDKLMTRAVEAWE